MSTDPRGPDVRAGVERGSRLPTDPGYWDRLAHRISSVADGSTVSGQPTRARTRTRTLAWTDTVRAARALAAVAVLAVLATWLGTDPPSATSPRSSIEEALIPDDPLAELLLGDGSAPPLITELIGSIPPR